MTLSDTEPRLDDADRERVWARDNQRHLALAAAAAAARLDARPDEADEPARAAELLAAEVRETTGLPPALDRLCGLFTLTAFERDLLVAVAAPELGLPTATGPVTFARALAALPDAHWSALLPDAPLRGWRLLDVPAQLPPTEFGGLSQLPLAVDERILHALLGADTTDDRLAGRARLVAPVCRLAPGQGPVVASLAALVRPAPGTEGCLLTGEDRLTRRQAVVDAARRIGLTVLAVDGLDLPDTAPAMDTLARLLAREAGLGLRLLLVEGTAASLPRCVRLLTAGAPLGVSAVLSADEAPPGSELPVLRLPPASAGERRDLFAAALREARLTEDPAELAERHPLTPAGITLAVERTGRLAAAPGHGDTGEAGEAGDTRARATGPEAACVPAADVAAACRAVAERPLHGLATVRRPAAGLDDLVLPDQANRSLRALLAHVRRRRRVHGDWGYAERGRGLAVTALFAGPSGTGKTTAAEAVAHELGFDVIAADLSQVVSKYIGETEKHLARLFDAAETGSVLLFDEGDALFAKRTQVRDSRDRYANLEVSYLLQRLETFRGIAILTTNAREAIDPAFVRRMRFVVTFPFPDAEQRALLWAGAFPPGVPTEGLDPRRLAQLAVSGGTIAQLALHAAFLAADEGVPVGMRHVLDAARIESDKLERPLAANEIRGWVPS
ncbi:ATP-binding protein [Streptomyces tanashiensis]|uniref:ATP-binding protein n=1 Tax=Streptomyces tanashiensis TaxID=67367 RepID=UPI00198EA854|nr:ATP-binding protein [Streptomyces tanashiensis]GGY10120.1 ATPase [Streptomyces tanashiensis]